MVFITHLLTSYYKIRRADMKSSRFFESVFLVILCLFTACSSRTPFNRGGDVRSTMSLKPQEVKNCDYYQLNPMVYAMKDGKRSTSGLNTLVYPRNFGTKENAEKDVDYNCLDMECRPNLIYNGECQKLCLTLSYMPEAITITRLDERRKEKEVDYTEGQESYGSGNLYTFCFDFSYEGDASVIYGIHISYPEDKAVDVAFKLRNGIDKPLIKEAIDINLGLSEEENKRLYSFLLNCSYTKTIHNHYLMNESIHIEKIDVQEGSPEVVVFKIMADNGVLSYGYLWRDDTGLLYGNALGTPQTFDVDKDGKVELLVVTSWSSGSTLDTIYVFDEDEKQVGITSYKELRLRLLEKQEGEYFQIEYMSDSPPNSGTGAMSIGTLQCTDEKGIKRYYIEKAEDDIYTNMQQHLAQNSY